MHIIHNSDFVKHKRVLSFLQTYVTNTFHYVQNIWGILRTDVDAEF